MQCFLLSIECQVFRDLIIPSETYCLSSKEKTGKFFKKFSKRKRDLTIKTQGQSHLTAADGGDTCRQELQVFTLLLQGVETLCLLGETSLQRGVQFLQNRLDYHWIHRKLLTNHTEHVTVNWEINTNITDHVTVSWEINTNIIKHVTVNWKTKTPI